MFCNCLSYTHTHTHRCTHIHIEIHTHTHTHTHTLCLSQIISDAVEASSPIPFSSLFRWNHQLDFGALLALGKESACNAGPSGLIPGSGRSSRGGNGNSLQDSCLGNPTGRGALEGYSPWGRKELGMTYWLNNNMRVSNTCAAAGYIHCRKP